MRSVGTSYCCLLASDVGQRTLPLLISLGEPFGLGAGDCAGDAGEVGSAILAHTGYEFEVRISQNHPDRLTRYGRDRVNTLRTIDYPG